MSFSSTGAWRWTVQRGGSEDERVMALKAGQKQGGSDTEVLSLKEVLVIATAST